MRSYICAYTGMALQSCLISKLPALQHADTGNATGVGVGVGEDNHCLSFLKKRTENLIIHEKSFVIICSGFNVHAVSPESSDPLVSLLG